MAPIEMLSPVEFYGRGLPRPRLYTDLKFNVERVDKPDSVTGPLIEWAAKAHWSMGGANHKRLPLAGKIEGNVEKLKKEIRKQLRFAKKNSKNAGGKTKAGRKGAGKEGVGGLEVVREKNEIVTVASGSLAQSPEAPLLMGIPLNKQLAQRPVSSSKGGRNGKVAKQRGSPSERPGSGRESHKAGVGFEDADEAALRTPSPASTPRGKRSLAGQGGRSPLEEMVLNTPMTHSAGAALKTPANGNAAQKGRKKLSPRRRGRPMREQLVGEDWSETDEDEDEVEMKMEEERMRRIGVWPARRRATPPTGSAGKRQSLDSAGKAEDENMLFSPSRSTAVKRVARVQRGAAKRARLAFNLEKEGEEEEGGVSGESSDDERW